MIIPQDFVELDFVLDFFPVFWGLDKIRQATLKLQHWQECYRCAGISDLVIRQGSETIHPTGACKVMPALLHGPLQGKFSRAVGSSLTRAVRTSFELPIKNPDFHLLTDL